MSPLDMLIFFFFILIVVKAVAMWLEDLRDN